MDEIKAIGAKCFDCQVNYTKNYYAASIIGENAHIKYIPLCEMCIESSRDSTKVPNSKYLLIGL
jgi:hypothetical protein